MNINKVNISNKNYYILISHSLKRNTKQSILLNAQEYRFHDSCIYSYHKEFENNMKNEKIEKNDFLELIFK